MRLAVQYPFVGHTDLDDLGDDRVRVWGVRGGPRTDFLKVSISPWPNRSSRRSRTATCNCSAS